MAHSNDKRSQPETLEEYRQRAAECERLAASSELKRNREIFLQLAATWHRLADEDEALARDTPATPKRPSPPPE
jgi:hypothetical protein